MSLMGPGLEAFMSVVRRKTVHAAAQEIGLTQTGITQRIRALESQLSTTLFLRSRRGMQLTEEGEALLRYCMEVKDLEGEALARISGTGETADLSVCITGPTSLMTSRVCGQCFDVMKDFPHLSVNFWIRDIEDRADALRSGAAQLALLPISQVAREMDSKVLRPERYVLVGAPHWKKRRVQEIIARERIIDFDPSDLMSFSYLEKYKLLDAARKQRHFVNNNETLIEMLSQGMGYGVLTLEVARPHLESGRLILLNSGKVYENRLALAWYPRAHKPRYLEALIRAIH